MNLPAQPLRRELGGLVGAVATGRPSAADGFGLRADGFAIGFDGMLADVGLGNPYRRTSLPAPPNWPAP